MKYVLIGDPAGHEIANSGNKKEIQLSGLYQWANVFQKYGTKGNIEPIWRKEDLEKYDIIHINYTPSNIQLPTLIKHELKDSSTKIILNVDLDVSKWSPNWSYYYTIMTNEIKLADYIFHVEPIGQNILQYMINSNVDLCPHPVDVNGLFDYMLKLEDREDIISTIFHRYTSDTLIQFLAQQDIPLRKVIFGMHPNNSKLIGSQGMYDQTIYHLKFLDFIKEIAKSRLGCDMYDGFSYGRVPIEFAALGIPAVVSNRIHSSCLFPLTSIDPYDTIKANELFAKLLTNADFADLVISTAHEKCSYYSLKNSYDRFKTMIEE